MQWRSSVPILCRVVMIGLDDKVTFEQKLKGGDGIILKISQGETMPSCMTLGKWTSFCLGLLICKMELLIIQS